MRQYSAQLKDQVEAYLNSQKWRFRFDNNEGLFTFSMDIGTKMQGVDCRVFIRETGITAFGYPSVKADPDTLQRVNEYITRANYGLVQGNFEMDYNDGEVRYKSYLHCGDDIPSLGTVEYVVDMAFYMWKRYGDGLLAVIFGGSNPLDEIHKAED